MCVIVDSCCSHKVLNPSRFPEAEALLEWLRSGGKIAHGGLLTRELCENSGFRRLLLAFTQAGMARRYPDDKISAEEARLKSRDGLKCKNDHHVLALAIVSGARILYSEDENLREVFRDRTVIPTRSKVQGKLLCGDGVANKRRVKELLRTSVDCK